MDFLYMIIIALQVGNVLSKKRISSSDESIENLLYFKDCQHKPKVTTTTTPAPRPEKADLRQMECPFPKMCCSMTCGENECGSPFPMRQMAMQNPEQIPQIKPSPNRMVQPVQNPIARGRKKRIQQPLTIPLQHPIGGRRDFGFSKERIKSLISQDNDIRKILKDLVRVTMQKVNLVDMISSRGTVVSTKDYQVSKNEEDDDELE